MQPIMEIRTQIYGKTLTKADDPDLQRLNFGVLDFKVGQ